MTSRVWTWGEGADDHVVVPSSTVSPTSSIVSFDSISSFQPTAAPRMDPVPSPQPTNSVGEMPIPKSRYENSAEPNAFEQYKHHERFFFEDGNITFLVEKVLYNVHRYFLNRDSSYFASRLTSAFWDQSDRARTIISMPDITVAEFDAFMSILYPLSFDGVDISSIEEWTSVLRLSTRWDFATIRSLGLRQLDLITGPLDRLVLGRTYAVDDWVLPALVALCERPQPINLDEARRMDLPDIILIHNIREAIRDSALTANPAEIRPLVEAWISDPLKPIDAAFDRANTTAACSDKKARAAGAGIADTPGQHTAPAPTIPNDGPPGTPAVANTTGTVDQTDHRGNASRPPPLIGRTEMQSSVWASSPWEKRKAKLVAAVKIGEEAGQEDMAALAAKAKAEADARARQDEEARMKAVAEAKARADASATAKENRAAKVKAEAHAKAKADAEAKAKAEAEAELEAKVQWGCRR